jgi:hypothetical protein
MNKTSKKEDLKNIFKVKISFILVILNKTTVLINSKVNLIKKN